MTRRSWLTLGVVLACALLSLSCVTPCLSGLSARRAESPMPTLQPSIPASEAAASRFEEKAKALEQPSFSVEFTDEEVTSYLAAHAPASGPIASPQVSFHPGKVVITGELTSPTRGHVTLTGGVQVAGGRLQLEFEDASVAGIAIPRAALASISDSVSQLIIDADAQVEIESVEVLEGLIRITGHRSRG